MKYINASEMFSDRLLQPLFEIEVSNTLVNENEFPGIIYSIIIVVLLSEVSSLSVSRVFIIFNQHLTCFYSAFKLRKFLISDHKIIWIVRAFWLVNKGVIALWSTKMTWVIWLAVSKLWDVLVSWKNKTIHSASYIVFLFVKLFYMRNKTWSPCLNNLLKTSAKIARIFEQVFTRLGIRGEWVLFLN